MIKLYRAHRDSQIQWIHDNPGKYVALNVTLLVAFIGYIEIKDRIETRKFEKTIEDIEIRGF